jgi:hypothetical protein
MSEPYVSVNTCPECGQRALYALDQDGRELYLDPEALGGNLAALDDANRIAWCRPAGPGTQLQLGEYLVSRHVCPLAKVIPLGVRATLRQTGANRRLA